MSEFAALRQAQESARQRTGDPCLTVLPSAPGLFSVVRVYPGARGNVTDYQLPGVTAREAVDYLNGLQARA
jgi:hypothetical protein